MPKPSGYSGLLQRPKPCLPKVVALLSDDWPARCRCAKLCAREMREHGGDDPPERPLQCLHTVQVGLQKRLQFRGEVDDAAFVVLRLAGVEADRSGVKVYLMPFKRQHLALHPPSVRVRERDRQLKI